MKIEIVGTTAGVMIADGTTADVTTADVMMIVTGVMIPATTDSDGHHHTPHHVSHHHNVVSYSRWRPWSRRIRFLPWTMEARPTHRH